MSIYDVFSGNKPFNKEEWAAQKQAQRQEAYDMIDNTCAEIAADGDMFRQYLDVQGQMPEATQLREKGKWRENRVYLDNDAQKIIILEPGKEYTRRDGTTATSFNAKEVYDISQTSAKGRSDSTEQKPMRELVSALIDASPVSFQPVDDLEMGAFYDSSQQMIFIRTGLTDEQLFVSMSKEVAAAVYDFKHNENRDASDFKSYCVAYMVSSKYGVDTKGFSFDKLPDEFKTFDEQALRSELGSMRDVLGEINAEMYKSLEKNKPAKSKEQGR